MTTARLTPMVAPPAASARPLVATLAALALGACSGGDPLADAARTTDPGSWTSTAEPTVVTTPSPTVPPFEPEMQVYDVPDGSGPHDVAPATDGGVWYTAQSSGEFRCPRTEPTPT